MSPVKALVLLAEGAEEMETVIVVNILRRGKIDVTLASLDEEGASKPVTCSRNVKLVPDCSLKEALDGGKVTFDAIILPGGLKGAENLAASEAVKKILTDQEAAKRVVAAVCAAPTAFLSHGIAKGKKVTSYPSFKEKMETGDYTYLEDRVVVDDYVVTSRGPGTCFEFALALVEKLVSKDVADQIKAGALII